MITSRAMSVIWDVYSVLLSYPYFRHYFWECTNNHTQSVEETGEDDFPQPFTPFSSFRPGRKGSENFQFPLNAKESMLLLLNLPGLLSKVHTPFRVTKEISREAIQRSASKVDSHRWYGMWEDMGQYLEDFSDSLEIHP